MKLKKSFAALLSLVMVCVFTIPAYAATGHQCTYRTWISYEYLSRSDSQHEVKQLMNYDCTDKSCPIEYNEVLRVYNENHQYSPMKFSGQEYHSGSLHYGYYVSTCSSCKHQKGEWRSWKCPGGNGGPCILPKAILPTCEIK